MTEPITVLMVEDEAMIRMNIVDELEDQGFRALEAGTADQAIALLEAHPDIRLVFTDVDMPGSMDGLRLAGVVHGRWPPVRIIVTSGKRMVEITDLPSGSVFFAKPYRHTEVLASMREMLA